MNKAYDYLNENVKLKEEEFFTERAKAEKKESDKNMHLLGATLESQRKAREDLNSMRKEVIVR